MLRRFGRSLGMASLLASALLVGSPSSAAPRRPTVTWSEIAIRPGEDVARLTKLFEKRLKAATKRAEWKPKRKAPVESPPLSKPEPAEAVPAKPAEPKPPVALVAKITRFDWTSREDVVHLDVAAIGRVTGGPTVKTKIRVSGRPSDRAKLEQDVLRIVAEGLVTRLAEIIRRRG